MTIKKAATEQLTDSNIPFSTSYETQTHTHQKSVTTFQAPCTPRDGCTLLEVLMPTCAGVEPAVDCWVGAAGAEEEEEEGEGCCSCLGLGVEGSTEAALAKATLELPVLLVKEVLLPSSARVLTVMGSC